MTESLRPRLGWAPRVQPDPAHVFNAYRMTLAAMSYPAWRLCVLDAVRAVCLALLGHPLLAAGWVVASWVTNFISQGLIVRWTRAAQQTGDDRTPIGLAVLALARSTLYV